MSEYRLVFAHSVKKDIDKLDHLTRQRIGKKLGQFLKQDDPLVRTRQLIDSKLGVYGCRIEHYRIVFDMHENSIEVVSIKHRKDVYR